MTDPVTLLIASHTPTATTGYGRVTRRLAHAFRAAGHEVTVLGSGYAGGPHELPYRIIPWNNSNSPEDIAGPIRELRPDVLLTIGDPWMFESLPRLPERRNLLWMAYFPIDGRPLPAEWKTWIQAIDVPVVFSRFSQEVIAAAGVFAENCESGRDAHLTLIYHGVDTKSFRPDDKAKAKERAHVQDHFVVGTVARNQQRKNLPALMKAFAAFAADKPDVLLYLHTQVRGEWDLQALARHLGIEPKTRVTAELRADRGVPDELLATVYNAMDVFVLPTMAEGFGLPIMEAQACGTPVLATDFSACPELLPDPIQRLKVKDTLVMHRNFEQAIVDTDDIVAKLEHFYHHRDELASLGKRCHEFAQQFEWTTACDQFVKLLASVQDRIPKRPLPPEPVTRLSPKPAPQRAPVKSRPWFESAETEKTELAAVGHSGNAQTALVVADDGDVITGRSTPKPKLRTALVHQKAGRLAEAEQECRQILTREPGNAAAMHLLGIMRGTRGDAEESFTLLSKAAKLRPDQAEIHNDLGVAWEAKGQPQQAVECYRRAVQLRPGVHQAWANLSNGLLQTHDISAALEASREAIRLDRSYAPAHKAHGAALAESGDPAQACVAFREAIRLNPEYVEAHASMALVLLSMGDFENGWQEHEWRRRLPSKLWQREGKVWDGSDPFGQAMLLYAEGGLGNTIQFIRYAPLLAEMGAILTVECQPGLVELLKTVKGIRQVVARGQSLPHHDLHCPLMSVPAILKSSQTIPSAVPYIDANPSRAQRWAGLWEKKDGFRVGICWQGEQKLVYRRNRSIPLSAFAPLSKVPSVRLISLQTGCPLDADFPVAELPGLDAMGGAFVDTAAVMQHLDLVITCDTSIAHLAGALGVPVWVALPSVADWRWMVDREDSPWYPTMRLFRQQKPNEWESVVERMARELAKDRS